MDRTALNNCINALLADIQTRTGMNVSLEIDNQYDGDAPNITLQYDGLGNITLLPNGNMQDAEFMFTLLLSSRTANGSQLANLLYAETQISKIFFNSRTGTSNIETFSLSIDDYEVKYYLIWGNKVRTDENEYTREFELKLTINKE